MFDNHISKLCFTVKSLFIFALLIRTNGFEHHFANKKVPEVIGFSIHL